MVEMLKTDIVLNPGLVDMRKIAQDMESGNMFSMAIDNNIATGIITDSEFCLAADVLKNKAQAILRANNNIDHVIYGMKEFNEYGDCVKGRLCLITLSEQEFQNRMERMNDNIACYVVNKDTEEEDFDYDNCCIEDCDFNCVGCQFLNDCPNSRVAW